LKEGARGSGEGSRWNRVRGAFVVVQVALSLVLLVCSGLLIRSFDKLLRVDVGFKTERLLNVEIPLVNHTLAPVRVHRKDQQRDRERKRERA